MRQGLTAMAALAFSLALAGCQVAAGGKAEAPQVGSGTTVAPAATMAAAPPLVAPVTGDSALGTLAGGFLGDRLGPAFGEKIRLQAAQAERRALASDATERWSDPDAEASGEVRPLRDFTDAAGRACREYSHRIRLARRNDSGSGIACRGSDGRWALVGG
jgi:surface antigen